MNTRCSALIVTFFIVFAGTAALLPSANAQEKTAQPHDSQRDKLEQLLTRSPSPPNVIGYINVTSLNKLLADQGINPQIANSVQEYWFVSKLELSELRPKWEAGYAVLSHGIDAEKLTQSTGGYVDTIEGKSVVWAPGQTYFVPGKSNQLGMLRPADRSLLSQWLREGVHFNGTDFLNRRAKPPEEFLSVMLAVELKDAFSPVPLAAKLADYQALKAQPPKSVANILASIQGVSIIVGRNGLGECIVSAEFAKSPASLKLIAGDLLAELLSRNGTAAPEVRTWKVSVEGHSLSFKGPITEATLSGLISIFSLQDKAAHAASTNLTSSVSQEQQAAYRTKSYFDDVNAIVERTRKYSAQTTGALAKWNDQRARQIDEMGTLKVDPDMVQYGSNVASLLRGNALNIRKGNIVAGKERAEEGGSNDSYGGGYYGGGYYGNGYGSNTNSVVDQQRVISARARGNAYANYRETLNQIDQLTAAMRREMTDKYQIQF